MGMAKSMAAVKLTLPAMLKIPMKLDLFRG